MAYWMLVFSRAATCPKLDAIEVPLFSDFRADYEIRHGTDGDWREIELAFVGPPLDDDDDDDEPPDQEPDDFATIFRDPVDSPRLHAPPGWTGWRAHLDELCNQLEDVAPRCNARWVQEFLREVKTIYHFTPHHAERREEAMRALRNVMWSLQQHAIPAIAYAEGEGYYDHEGSLLTWEFDRDAHQGSYAVALHAETGWLRFSIDLAAEDQREAFKAGAAPTALRGAR